MARPLGSARVPSKFDEIFLGLAADEPEDSPIAFDIHDARAGFNFFTREGTNSALDHVLFTLR